MIKIKALLLSLLLLAVSSLSFAAEPLPAKEAFKFDAVVEGSSIKATWTMVDDYYLYKAKVRFESATPGTEFGEVIFPKGKVKHGIRPDGTEGDVETYAHRVTIEIPITKSNGGEIKLIGHSQGCAEELGICYPPQKREKLLTVAALSPGLAGISDLSSQLGLTSSQSDSPLAPEDAFAMKSRIDGDTLLVTWTVANDYYMYREKFSIQSNTGGISFGPISLPPGKMKHGILPNGKEGEVEVYTDEVTISYPIIASKPDISKIKFFAIGQGCAESLGICYPPQKRPQSLSVAKPFMLASANVMNDKAVAMTKTDTSAAKPAASSVNKETLWETIGRIAFAFLSGLALTFTPCVLPMLPIISSIIVGQGDKVTKTQGGVLAAIYVLGTAVIWTIAGYVAGATGEQLAAYTSHPFFIIPVAVVLFGLSLAMFGLFNLQMPSFLQSKAQESSTGFKSGTYIGVFMMGVLASIIAGACVSPILILNLGVALETHDPILGSGIMFAMAMGMGVPIILMGVGAGWLLPKAGTWMDAVKYVFGAILIGLSIYILSLVDWIPVLYFWAPFLIITGVYMGAMQSIPEGASGWRQLRKGLGLFLIVWGVFALLGAMQGNKDILSPVQLGQISSGSSSARAGHEELFIRVSTLEQMERLLASAKADGKPAVIDYFATWCTDCKLMEKKTFADPEVHSLLQDKFVLIQPDVTDQFSPNTQPMKDKFKVFGPPAIIFIDAQGNERKDLNVYGFQSKQEFLKLVKQL